MAGHQDLLAKVERSEPPACTLGPPDCPLCKEAVERLAQAARKAALEAAQGRFPLTPEQHEAFVLRAVRSS